MSANIKRHYNTPSTIKEISLRAIQIALWAMIVFGLLHILNAQVTSNQALNNDENIDMIEMVDYKRNLLLGYIVFKNGRAKEKIILKEPIPFDKSNPPEKPTQNDLNQLEKNASKAHNPAQPQPQKPTPESKEIKPAPKIAQPQPQPPTQQIQRPTPQATPKPPSTNKSSSENKYAHIKKSKDFIANSSIEQIVGPEARMLNELYKNREWNKKRIIYEIDTRVLNIRD